MVDLAPAFASACAAGLWSQGIQLCTKILRHDKENAGVLCDRGLCYIQLELHKHAIKDCEAAIKCGTHNQVAKALLIKGQALVSLSRTAEAISSWEEARSNLLEEKNLASFDLSLYLQLAQLITTHSQSISSPATPTAIASSVSIHSENRKSLLPNSQSAPEGTRTLNGFERVQEEAAITGTEKSEELPLRDGSGGLQGPELSGSDKDTTQTQPTATTSLSSTKQQPNGDATLQAENKPDPPPPDVERPSHDSSSGRTADALPNKKSSNRNSATPKKSASKGKRAGSAPEGVRQSEKYASQRSADCEAGTRSSGDTSCSSRGDSDRGRAEIRGGISKDDLEEVCRGVFEAGARSSGDTSCSGRGDSTRAELRGGISRDDMEEVWRGTFEADERGEDEEETGRKEEEKARRKEEKARRKAKDAVELPPKIMVNGVDWRVHAGVQEVNAGNLTRGIAIFDKILDDEPRSSGALVGRGSAFAMEASRVEGGSLGPGEPKVDKRKMQAAIADFDLALEIAPHLADTWKRRGQAKASLGRMKEAVADLTEAVRIDGADPHTLSERGTFYFELRDFIHAEADLREHVRLAPRNVKGIRLLGRCLITQGKCRTGIAQLRNAAELTPDAKEIYANIAQAYKEISDCDRATMYFEKALAAPGSSLNTYHLWGLLRYGLGDHRGALELFNKVLEKDPRSLECRYLKAACLHATGQYPEAVLEYDTCLRIPTATTDTILVAFLAFYQREVARYTQAMQWGPLSDFNIDEDLDSTFKEAWCKKLNPVTVVPAFDPQKEWERAERVTGGEQENVRARHVRQLLMLADRIGKRVQYSCDGFLNNSRQHRMAGLAALEVAQAVSASWQAMWEARQCHVADGGEAEQAQEGGTTSKSKKSPRKLTGRKGGHSDKPLKWRTVFDIVVKWRQIVEPCDPVVWVDKLSEKEFAAGFGSHTPLLLGHQMVVRYYPNFPRAFGVAKDLMLAKDMVKNARDQPVFLLEKEQRDAVSAAADCGALYDVIKEDFWISTPCYSIAQPGTILDGTRLTVQKQRDVDSAYEFSIRTPCTPNRWKKFDRELAAAWEAVCAAACARLERPDDEDCSRCLWDNILALVFYWYNFMPLCRGTAVVGYITLLGLFLAAGMEVTAAIPQGMQVDWEAILTPDVEVFASAVRPWLYPSLKPIDLVGEAREPGGAKCGRVPRVTDAFPSVQSIVTALSTAESKWRDIEGGGF